MILNIKNHIYKQNKLIREIEKWQMAGEENQEESLTQKTLMEQFELITNTMATVTVSGNDVTSGKVAILKELRETSKEMLATYERVEKMHAETAQAKIIKCGYM